ncbi:MAG: gliding-motility protein MglA [Acidobacteria bacterium]|nr:gliding-motility protein MglA [Acidobacteriota bacterium]
MSFVNYASREINCKIVYCGPGLAGKTTNITFIHDSVNPASRGRLICLNTEGERTLFFDFLPLDLGSIGGFRTRFHLYTVPGQVLYQAARRLVLKGADGLIFVADSDPARRDANLEAMRDLKLSQQEQGRQIERIPYALQLNKRDVAGSVPAAALAIELKIAGEPVFEAVARNGAGVRETFKSVARQVLEVIRQELLVGP